MQLEKGDNSLALSVGTGNMAPGSPHRCPASTDPTGPFREIGILRDSPLHDALDGVIYPVEIAGGKLGVQRPGVEQRRGRGAEPAALVEIVETRNPGVLLIAFVQAEPHGNPQPENLGWLDTGTWPLGLINQQVFPNQKQKPS